ncbi:alpha/beta hydrolase [Blastococcus sp. CT_GayMR16]|nr:alpha/beta hydrolase [Blastococcus sp. CT_GayMR16]
MAHRMAIGLGMPYYESGHVRLEYRTLGPDHAEIVVHLHGFPQPSDVWMPIADRLQQEGFRSLILNQRGYPDTQVPRGVRNYRLRLLVDDVIGLLESIGSTSAHIVGHDWGGSVAWSLAHRRPDLVKSLTVISMPHPQALARSLLVSSQALRSWYVIPLMIPSLVEQVARFFPRLAQAWLASTGLDDKTAEAHLERMQEGPHGLTGPLNWYRAIPLNIMQEPWNLPITPRTLYIWSRGDQVVTVAAAKLTRRYVAGPFDFEEIDGSHWLPEEHSTALVELLLQHFRGGRARIAP